MIRIEPEAPGDGWEIEYLLDTAFAPGRTALSSYRLREGVKPVRALCLTARDDAGDPGGIASLAGCIRYWPIRIGKPGWPALLLGPVATHPTRQGEGIAARLILESLDLARDRGWERAVLIGDEPYYGRFGFHRDLARGLDYPPPTNPNRLLARELTPGAMDGVRGMVRKWMPDVEVTGA